MRRSTISVVALLIFAIVSDGCKKPPPIPSVTIAVVGQSAMPAMPVTLAKQLGYFRDEHLNVHLVDVQGASRAVEALSGHSADVGAVILDNLYLAANQGKRFQAFELISQTPGLVLVVAPKSYEQIRSIKDLAGHTVGVTTLGASTETLVRFIADQHGLSSSSIKFIPLGSPRARIAALEHGEVDAAVISEPGIAILRAKYGKRLRILADTRSRAGTKAAMGTALYPGAVLFADPQWLNHNPEIARHVALAVLHAQQYARSHSAAEVAIHLPKSFQEPDPDAYLEGLAASVSMYSPDGRFTVVTSRTVMSALAASHYELNSRRVDFSSLTTNRYLP